MPTKGKTGLTEGGAVEWNSKSGFETTSRLLAAIANEGLAVATVAQLATGSRLGLCFSSNDTPRQSTSQSIWVGLVANLPYDEPRMCLLQLLHPDDLRPPIYYWDDDSAAPKEGIELDPSTVFATVCQWLGSDKEVQQQIIEELNSSVVNQGI